MFERFAAEARSAVVDAQEEARGAGDRRIEPAHILGALARRGADDGLLARHGVTYEAVRREIVRGGGAALDGEALAVVGVDLDAVRAQADATFGDDALERAGRRTRGHLRFTRAGKRVLELALRATVAGPGREIGTVQLLAGVLSVDDARLAAVVSAVCEDPDGLRIDVDRAVSGRAA